MTIGVAISTTGDEHRLGFLETCVASWKAALPLGSVVMVTVDGTEEEAQRVADLLYPTALRDGGVVYRVGQRRWAIDPFHGRLGVAANKNTGLELLSQHHLEHVFLSDDDTWPLGPDALEMHTDSAEYHSMVCWGHHRLTKANRMFAVWSWPRGVVLYMTPGVIDQLGGMDERFGIGGHEHVEYSRRIHQAGFTPYPFVSPSEYASLRGMGAAKFWHAEDMPRRGEPLGNTRARRRKLTSVLRRDGDWEKIGALMKEKDGDTSYVPFTAEANGRSSATMIQTCRAEEPKPRSQGEKEE